MPAIKDINELKKISFEIRKDVIKSLSEAGSGHLGGSLGLADIFTCLYFNILNHNPQKPNWEDRNRLILSIGHVDPVFYTALAHAGYFDKKELLTLRKLGSRLHGMNDKFGESGKPDELMQKYSMKAEHIMSAVKKMLKKD